MRYALVGAGALGLICVVVPRPAHACGGFFCSTTPVDQSGETVVYGLEADGTVTMAVQIQYQGDDDDFAWIVPVVAPPERISVGAEALFSTLAAATNPVFAWDDYVEGTCRPHPTCTSGSGGGGDSGGGCGMAASSPSGWSGDYVDAAAPDPSTSTAAERPMDEGVTVYGQDVVGPYETVVLGAATATEVVGWLREHAYDVPEDTIPLLDPYAEAGQVFVALRLSANTYNGVLRPLVMRIPSSEACLPIRLTAIATVPDMPITAFFLGEHGVMSSNYSTVDVDTVDPAFWEGTRSWNQAVSNVVDSIGGKGFGTGYSGPTPAVRIELPPVEDLAGEPDAAVFVGALGSRGYPGDPVLLELFERYIVPPTGSTPQSYYNCLAGGRSDSCGAPESFDPEGLAAAITSQITEPRREAQAMVNRHGHLTRLFTTMDAEDMTLDPIFVQRPEVPDVSNVHLADLVTLCSNNFYREDAPREWRIEGERFSARSGTRADDHAYCRSRGGTVGEPTATVRDDDSGGCMCGVAGAAAQGGPIAGALLILLARRSRQRRRRD